MSSTFLSLHYHIVFGTKHREKHIVSAWRPQLHAYVAGILRNLDGNPFIVGGVEDHIHILTELRAVHPLSDVVREVKRSSCRWVHDEVGLPCFAWQSGYAAFSVSPGSRDPVHRYILNQEEHHRTRTFREELVEILAKAGIDYDPRYLE